MELIWGGDHDLSEENEDYQMVTNLSCQNCGCHVEVYLPHPPKTESNWFALPYILNMNNYNIISTPCIKVCKLNSRGKCEGCGRTFNQIQNWPSYSENKRKKIMEKLNG